MSKRLHAQIFPTNTVKHRDRNRQSAQQSKFACTQIKTITKLNKINMDYCRLCARTDKKPLIPILENNPLNIREKLIKLLQIEVSERSDSC